MEFLGFNIVEHAAVAADEVWIIHKNEAPQVPADLRGNLPVPCILTGDAARARHLLLLLRAVESQYVNTGASLLLSDATISTPSSKPHRRSSK